MQFEEELSEFSFAGQKCHERILMRLPGVAPEFAFASPKIVRASSVNRDCLHYMNRYDLLLVLVIRGTGEWG